jgi:hypothetical protein
MTGSWNSASLDQQGKAIVERLGGRWTPGGGMCRCPAHDDRSPSLSVRAGDRSLLFHCFAGCETARVIGSLKALGMFRAEPPRSGSDAQGSSASRRDHAAAARKLWAAARSIPGTPAERYLRGRGLGIQVRDLRYLARTPCGRGAEAIHCPALLAAVRDGNGLVAVHRTFIDPVSASLARFPVPKRALGPLGEGAVRLASADGGTLGLAEGVESALAAAILTGLPCWATLGSERFARVALPASVRRLILFLDNDSAGRRAEKLARATHRAGALTIEARYPQAPGSDWNDALLARD